jgi:serralysin
MVKPSYAWEAAAAQISRNAGLNFTPAVATPITMTYAYRETATAPPVPAGRIGWVGGLDFGMEGFQAFTPVQIEVMESSLRLIQDVANITLIRNGRGTEGVGAYSDAAQILIGNFTSGYLTSIADGSATRQSFQTATGYVRAAKVWFDGSETYLQAPQTFGAAPSLYMHEIMHALGLSHPGDYNADIPGYSYANSAVYAQDSRQYTVMSYFSETETGANFGGPPGMTPMLHDIAALQKLYGANMTTRAGTTVYGFNSTTGYEAYNFNTNVSRRAFSIWDGGGEDTLDLSGFITPSTVSLEAETFSSAGTRADGGLMIHNISIAKGVVIENAKGGRGSDLLVGNAADNRLTGNAGNDRFVGKGGQDLIDGGEGLDTAFFAMNIAAATVSMDKTSITVRAGSDGIDTLTGVERLAFLDRTIALDIGAGQAAGAVFRLYQMALGRMPDVTGITYWVTALDQGTFDISTVARSFSQSLEFTGRFGVEAASAAHITAFYQKGLGRTGAPDDVLYWRRALEAGQPIGDVLIGFSESPEHIGNLAPLLGQGVVIGAMASPL